MTFDTLAQATIALVGCCLVLIGVIGIAVSTLRGDSDNRSFSFVFIGLGMFIAVCVPWMYYLVITYLPKILPY